MIRLEDCNVEIRSAQTDRSGLSTMQKIYYMARGQPVELVEEPDAVWRELEYRDFNDHEGYEDMSDLLNYYKTLAGWAFGLNSEIWVDYRVG